MTKTYEELLREREELSIQIDRERVQGEPTELARIREEIRLFGFTRDQVFGVTKTKVKRKRRTPE